MYFSGDWYADNYIMTEILSTVDFYSGTERRKMLKTPKGNGSMLYGYTWKSYLSPTKNRTPSQYKGLWHTKVKDLYPDLEDVFNEFASIYFPDFNFLQVQMNKNFPCPPHFDSKNIGESVLCCFGNYKGGRTFVQYDDNIVKKLDPRAAPCRFNGSKFLHWVEPYEGDRYSLVFYSNYDKLQLRWN